MNKIKIGITGTGSLIGQTIIKSVLNSKLNEKIDMVGFDYFKDTIGSYWVGKNFLLPDFLKKEIEIEAWLGKVIEYINSEDIKLLFIGVDFELKLFAKYKRIIESKTQCRVLVSDSNVIEITDDKYLTYNFLKGNKLYHPITLLPEELVTKDVRFPCVVKPRYGFRSKDVFIVHTRQALEERLPLIENPIIQEITGLADNEYTSGIIYLDDTLKEMITLKRDLKDGNTITAYFTKDTPEIISEYIANITAALKPFGACNFQLRLDTKGIPRVFEINARHSGTTYIRSIFGFNEVEYILAYFLGFEIEKFKIRKGIVKRYYEEMFLESHGLK